MANWCSINGHANFENHEVAERVNAWFDRMTTNTGLMSCGSTHIHGFSHRVYNFDTGNSINFSGDVPWALENDDVAKFLCELLKFGPIGEFKIYYEELSSDIYGEYTYTPEGGLVDHYVPPEYRPEYPEFDSEDEEDEWRDNGGDYDMWADALSEYGVYHNIELNISRLNIRTEGIKVIAS